MISDRKSFSRLAIQFLILSSGFASLSWEVIWQIRSTLALGVSAWGTAITLAVTMGGMSLGGYFMGRFLRDGLKIRSLCVYGTLECVIGIAGLFLTTGFRLVERIDGWAYMDKPGNVSLVHILGIASLLGVPTLCMGATLPVFGLISRQFGVSIAKLYGLNTIGAAAGSLFVALVLIPLMGIAQAIFVIAGVNVAVCIASWLLDSGAQIITAPSPEPEAQTTQMGLIKEAVIVFVTGFATFTLEIAWFRSLAAAFPDRADIFAMMLACLLIALGLASRSVPRLKRKKKSLGARLCLAGVVVLVATALFQWSDIIWLMCGGLLNRAGLAQTSGLINPTTFAVNSRAVLRYAIESLAVFSVIFCLIVPPIRFLGVAFPWILEDQRTTRKLGGLYALNTFGAILGAIGTAWVLLPTIGFAHAASVAGVLVVVAGLMITPPKERFNWALFGVFALLTSLLPDIGGAEPRVQGLFANIEGKPAKVLGSFQGPESTVSVIEYDDGSRVLIINSSSASGQSGRTYKLGEHYMNWMGHLPMLLHPHPKNALVICFGTGQTSNAVRHENPESLDIVDINQNVFKLAHNFSANEDVLHDPRTKAIVMDGRAYLRRTSKVYDIITLEPMPPTDAGVNALYSRQFYELARNRLGPEGVIAQWLPFHCVAPVYSASIAKTFLDVFPNAILWIDPDTKHDGILLGTKDNSISLGTSWPGFSRTDCRRDLNLEEVQKSVALDARQLKRYAAYGEVVSDDNQLLGYGKSLVCYLGLLKENFELLHRANEAVSAP